MLRKDVKDTVLEENCEVPLTEDTDCSDCLSGVCGPSPKIVIWPGKVEKNGDVLPKSSFRYLLFLILGSLLALSGIATMIWKPVDILLHERLRMVRGLPPFEWWKNPPDEVLLRAYVFNITNSKEFMNGESEKLHVQEVGPIIYREKLHQTNIKFHENGSMTYTATRVPVFLPEMNTLSLKSKITVANFALLGMTSYMWDASFVTRLALNMLINRLGSEPFVDVTIEEYLWNFTDPLMHFTNKITPHLVPVVNIGILHEVYRDFVDEVTVYVGVDNGHSKFFKIDKWRGGNGLGAWENETCDSVQNASEGVSYHQYVKRNDTIKYLRKTICRAFDLYYAEDVKLYGMTAYKFILPNNTWHRPKNLEDECYRSPTKAYPIYPSGVSDISPCYYNLPIVTSFPHMMSSSPEVTRKLEGLNPSWEKHGSSAIIEPLSGIPLTATARSQVSLYVQDMKGFPKYKRLSNVPIPMFWLEYNQVGLPYYIRYLLYFTVVILPATQFYISLGLILVAFIIFSTVSSKMLNNFIVKRKGTYTAVNVVFGRTIQALQE